jgi:replicative DNA helicase
MSSTTPVTSEILDRQPPFNLDAEMGVLGSIMLRSDACDDVAMILRADEFYDDANRTLFEHMLEMHNDGRKIDTTLLVEKLRLAGDFERIGGMAYLARVSKSVPSAAHATYYATIVREKATFRSLIDASTEILREAYEEVGPAAEVRGRAEARLLDIGDRDSGADKTQIASVFVNDWVDEFDRRQAGEATTGIMTGYTAVDSAMNGLRAGELIILAARPSMGKTAFALNIAEHVAVDKDIPTLFVSLEMTKSELSDRLHSSRSRVYLHRIKTGGCGGNERSRVIEAAAVIHRSPLLVNDAPSLTISQIASTARRHKRQHDIGLIVIDYLQLIEPDNQKDPRQEQVAKMSRRLKHLARELQVPVLCLSQLNRQSEQTKDNIPRLTHLRESGAIEQDADGVIFVHRENYYTKEAVAPGEAESAQIIIAKQRNGPQATCNLLWFGAYQRFDNEAESQATSCHNYTPEFATYNDGEF